MRHLVDSYGVAVDDKDRAALRALFVEEGRLTVYALGSPTPTAEYRGDELGGVIDFVERYEATLHFVGNHVCELHESEATAHTYCVAHHLRHDGTTMRLIARYRDAYCRTAAGWRFTARDCRLLWKERGA